MKLFGIIKKLLWQFRAFKTTQKIWGASIVQKVVYFQYDKNSNLVRRFIKAKEAVDKRGWNILLWRERITHLINKDEEDICFIVRSYIHHNLNIFIDLKIMILVVCEY